MLRALPCITAASIYLKTNTKNNFKYIRCTCMKNTNISGGLNTGISNTLL